MATASTATTDKTTTETPVIAQKVREQLLSTLRRGQQLSVDAAQTWVTAVSVLPVPDLTKIPGVPALPALETSTTFAFDVAADLLNAQRDFALQLGNVFTSAKSA
jgi:hypothetical protein